MILQMTHASVLFGSETTLHFLLKCPNFRVNRQQLLEKLNTILLLNDLADLSSSNMVHLLLYGHEKTSFNENQVILKETIKFIEKSGRFSQT